MNRVKSHKPKKQRRFHYHKPLHLKQAGLSVHLGKKSRQQLGMKSVSVRKNDTVKVLRGAKKGSSGKITGIDYEKGIVFIEKLVRKKASGEEIPLPVHASNLLVTEPDRSDAKRFKRRKGKAAEGEKPGGKEKEKAAEKKEGKEDKHSGKEERKGKKAVEKKEEDGRGKGKQGEKKE